MPENREVMLVISGRLNQENCMSKIFYDETHIATIYGKGHLSWYPPRCYTLTFTKYNKLSILDRIRHKQTKIQQVATVYKIHTIRQATPAETLSELMNTVIGTMLFSVIMRKLESEPEKVKS